MAISHSKPQRLSSHKLFTISLLLFFSFLILLFSSFLFFSALKHHYNTNTLTTTNNNNNFSFNDWFHLFSKNIHTQKLKIGLVNVETDIKLMQSDPYGLVESVSVKFGPVSKDKKWEDFFPVWIDEDYKWGPPCCPEIPMPRMESYRGLDVIVAKIPCGGGCGGGGKDKKEKGIRDLFRLQVNLVVANLAVENGLVNPEADRTVYVVFIGDCGPMQEIFTCDDLLTNTGDYWVYKPQLRKLKQKILMPVGSCQIAPPYAESGKEIWRSYMLNSVAKLQNQNTYHQIITYHRKLAYVTVLHSSEAYVCGAIALAQSIIQTNSTKDLILLHDSSITLKSLRGLRAAGWKTRLIQPIKSPFARKGSYNEWNYSKLRIWQLTDYDKIIFIDSDIVVLKNMDVFFTYPQLSASGNDKHLFNSGIMVIEPSECTFNYLMSKQSILESYNGGDQGFLNEAFTWWHRLPSKLNRLKVFVRNGKHVLPNDSYTIHSLGLKPWMCYRDYDCNWDMRSYQIFASDSAHKRWWQIYDAMPKKLHKFCGLTKKMDARIRKWRGIAKKLGLVDGHWKINPGDPRQHYFVN